MKMKFLFKDPDAVSETIYNFVRNEACDKKIDTGTPAGRVYVIERVRELEEMASRFFEFGEYAEIVVDFETNEATFVPARSE